jgi:hypothetical protein
MTLNGFIALPFGLRLPPICHTYHFRREIFSSNGPVPGNGRHICHLGRSGNQLDIERAFRDWPCQPVVSLSLCIDFTASLCGRKIKEKMVLVCHSSACMIHEDY